MNEEAYTKLKQQLDRKEKVEKVLIATSIEFSTFADFDEALNSFIKRLLELIQVDRVYITMIENDFLSISHEATAEGQFSIKQYVQKIPYKEMPWFKKINMAQGYVAIKSLDDFPEEASMEKELYLKVGTQASVIKSFVSTQAIKGFITLEQSQPRKEWEPEFIQLLNYGSVLIEHTLERLNAEKLLIAAKEKAEESDRLKSAFIANLSHEIRTPLNAIVGFSELLVHTKQNTEKAQKYSRIIEHNSRQLTSVISDILDIAKMEAGVMELNENPVMLNPFLQDLFVQYYESQLKNNDTQLEINIDKNENLCIYVDATRLKQIVDNLVKNALKFTTKGSVSFGYEVKNDLLYFFVKDTGIGIRNEHFMQIFERFNQVDLSGLRNYGGNGLGLSICKQLVTLMGGKIWLESEIGKGSTFFFTIPIKIAPEQAVQSVSVNYHDFQEELKDSLIIVIDDTDDCRLYLQIILESAGAKCFCYKDPCNVAKEILNFNKLDAVLLDIQMPDCGGVDVLTELKAIMPDLPVIAVTADAMTGDKEKYMNLGFDAYIPKPISQFELLNTIIYLTRKKK